MRGENYSLGMYIMAIFSQGSEGEGDKHEAYVYVVESFPSERATVDDIMMHCSRRDRPKSESLVTITLSHDEALAVISQLALRIKAQKLVKS